MYHFLQFLWRLNWSAIYNYDHIHSCDFTREGQRCSKWDLVGMNIHVHVVSIFIASKNVAQCAIDLLVLCLTKSTTRSLGRNKYSPTRFKTLTAKKIHKTNTSIMTRKLWRKASITPPKSFSYEYYFTEEVLMNNRPKTTLASYKSLSMHCSLFVAMVLPNYPLGCHSNQSNPAFWTKCVYSEENYSINISIKLLSTYLQWVRNKGRLSFFPSQVGHLSPLHLHRLPGAALAVLPRH